ncbi:hypothetical protein [Photorhabdus luminescens]|nr:hypothetical protein [Photorhabdus luminescens]
MLAGLVPLNVAEFRKLLSRLIEKVGDTCRTDFILAMLATATLPSVA